MKLSVLDLVPILQGVDVSSALKQSVRLAQAAEQLGYLRYWVSEHHDMEQLACAAPEVLLAHIGAYTTHIRIGSGAVLLPHYKPLKVVESFHLLASLYPGRVDLGIGRAPGGSAHAVLALNDNFLEQIRQLPESLQALKELLTHDYKLEEQRVIARPVPPAAPELWLLGTSRKSAQYAAQLGAGFVFGQFMSDQDAAEALSIYRQSFQSSSLGSVAKTIVAVGVVCAETETEAQNIAAQGGLLFQTEASNSDDKQSRAQRVWIGNPQQIREQLLQLQDRYQIDELMILTMASDYNQRIRSYELLANEMLAL
ncbi:LLM class flavin-dependent oxidoreductase [Paenibacillus eucommiae]|uniref:LLM class flavin-dependent oxidoreductase n=1 Tax=Paenibacillus eucommiae TaxID=1355755 RepID=UPI0035E4043F